MQHQRKTYGGRNNTSKEAKRRKLPLSPSEKQKRKTAKSLLRCFPSWKIHLPVSFTKSIYHQAGLLTKKKPL